MDRGPQLSRDRIFLCEHRLRLPIGRCQAETFVLNPTHALAVKTANISERLRSLVSAVITAIHISFATHAWR
jgi:hypothetical protein